MRVCGSVERGVRPRLSGGGIYERLRAAGDMKTFFVGLDLGRRHDFTGLAVVERVELQGAFDPVAYGFRRSIALRVRYVERIPLGTEYVEIVSRLRRVMEAPALVGTRHLAVDATDVGGPVVELLRRAGMDCRLWAVSITEGGGEGWAQGLYRVARRDLLVGMQLLLEQGMIQIAEGLPERAALVKEFADMRVKVTRAGNEQYEAGSGGQHDDLVSALSLACWAVRRTGGLGGVERRGRVV
jgi:hypothetical protein